MQDQLPAQHMIREDAAAKQVVPFAYEYNGGLLSHRVPILSLSVYLDSLLELT
jgi:hypothetical protein